MFRLNKKTAIKLSGDHKFNNIQEFLNYFFRINEHFSYYNMCSRMTFYKHNSKRQCAENKLRSPKDVAILAKEYFPNLSYRKILTEIVTFVGYYENGQVCRIIQRRACSTISSPNMQFYNVSKANCKSDIVLPRLKSSISVMRYTGKSGYSWKSLLKFLDLTEEQIAEIQFNKCKTFLKIE